MTQSASIPVETSPAPRSRRSWRLSSRDVAVVIALAAIGFFASIPANRVAATIFFARQLSSGAMAPRFALHAAAIISLVSAWVTVMLGVVGLGLARRVSINALPLAGTRGDAAGERRWGVLWRAAVIGIALAGLSLLIVGAQRHAFGVAPHAGHRTGPMAMFHARNARFFSEAGLGWPMVSLIIGAPILEEIQLRLFLMSLLAWILTSLAGARSGRRWQAAMWLAVVISGVAFGGLHVFSGESGVWWQPLWVQVLADPRTYAGVVLGWVFWRWGLESSIVSHGTMNLIVIGGVSLASLLIR